MKHVSRIEQLANRWRLFPALVIAAGFAACTAPAQLKTVEESIDRVPAVSDEDGPVGRQEALRTIVEIADDAPEPERAAMLVATLEALSQLPLYKDSRAELLIDGPATYDAMMKAIAGAKQFIHLETYIFADDEIGRLFSDALAERAEDGVRVRVIYDSFGSRSSDEEFFARMERAGVELRPFNVVNPAEGGNPLAANTRNHRKIMIVDGVVAFTGGINFSQYYSEASEHRRSRDPLAPGWRDTHVAIHGPAVAGLDAAFAASWNKECDDTDCQIAPASPPNDTGSDVVAVIQGRGGDNYESSIYWAYLEAIRLASDKVWITQAYFAPDSRFVDFLLEAADRGVDVRMIVPAFSDTNVVVHATRAHYGRLLERGIEIYETTNTVLHAKTAVIDGIWSTVGSSNLDYRSILHNHELNVIVFGAEFASQLEAQFEKDIQNSQAVSLEAWKDRPLSERAKELASKAFQYWL